MRFKTKIDGMDLLVIMMLSLIFSTLITFIPNHNSISYMLGMMYSPVVYLVVMFFRKRS